MKQRRFATLYAAACAVVGWPLWAFAAGSPAVNATGCLHVSKTGPSASCSTQSSLSVELQNTCSYPVRAQICLRGADHLWVACADRNSMAPKDTMLGNSCDSDGGYTYWGCSKFSDSSGKCGGDDLIGKATNVPTK